MGDTRDSPNEKRGWGPAAHGKQTSFRFDQAVREPQSRVRLSVVPLLGVALLTACGGNHHAAATQLRQ